MLAGWLARVRRTNLVWLSNLLDHDFSLTEPTELTELGTLDRRLSRTTHTSHAYCYICKFAFVDVDVD